MADVARKRLALKLIAAFFAIIIWFVAIRDHNPEITRRFDNISITVENETVLNSNGWTLTQRVENSVDVQFRGRAQDFIGLDSDDFHGYVDLSIVSRQGDQDLPVNLRNLPPGIELHRIPQSRVSIDALISKEIPITIDMNLSLAEGFIMRPYSLKPQGNVRVSGPSNLLQRITTASISVAAEELLQTISHSLKVTLFDLNGQVIVNEFVSVTPEFLVLTIPVYPIKRLPITTNLVGSPAHGFEVTSIEIIPSVVEVTGENSTLDRLNEITTEIIDLQYATSNIQENVRLNSYAGISIVPGQALNAQVSIQISEIIEEKEFTISKVEIRNLNEQLTAKAEETELVILVRGSALDLEKVTSENLIGYLDLTGIDVGSHEVLVSFELPEGIELLTINQSAINVVVSN